MEKLNEIAGGALFYKKFFGTPAERAESLEYLYNDIVMTVEIATKLGILS